MTRRSAWWGVSRSPVTAASRVPEPSSAATATPPTRGSANRHPRDAIVGVRPFDYLSSSSLLVRRAAWVEVGGFDEEIYPGVYVDADFCTALWNAGWRVLLEPRSVVVHDPGAAPASASATSSTIATASGSSRSGVRASPADRPSRPGRATPGVWGNPADGSASRGCGQARHRRCWSRIPRASTSAENVTSSGRTSPSSRPSCSAGEGRRDRGRGCGRCRRRWCRGSSWCWSSSSVGRTRSSP